MKWNRIYSLKAPEGTLSPFQAKIIIDLFREAKTIFTGNDNSWRDNYVIGEMDDSNIIAVALSMSLHPPNIYCIVIMIENKNLTEYVEIFNNHVFVATGSEYERSGFRELRKKFKYRLLDLPAPELYWKISKVLRTDLDNEPIIQQLRNESLRYA